MKIHLLNIKKSLNKAYQKERVSRSRIDLLKKNLKELFNKINEDESEEHLKNIVSDFLKDSWYKEINEINTKDRKDLVIHTGKSTKESVGVILEVKRPSNKTEMISELRPNTKSMHELILYYFRERSDFFNIDIKYLIITNIYEWFIFDANWFEVNIFRNNRLRKEYDSWKISGKDTKFFYENIARPFLEDIEDPIHCTYFDLKDYTNHIKSNNEAADNRLIDLYKILSPEHLLKLPFANDSNTLDKKFYTEFLYLLGLEEVNDGAKKLIRRKDAPINASLLENTINKLSERDSLFNLSNSSSFGDNRSEQLFNLGLELCITWVNRLLFLKLLEAQLVKYHKGDRSYLFLNSLKVFDFDELGNLFFQVLAEVPSKRREDLAVKFEKVPYLNSSLFERTDLERKALDIGNLDNRLQFPLYANTVLKDASGRRKTGTLTTLQYLFEFLDAFDFTSEGAAEIQEENKNLINASVLGLIFEKINGYKEGSFFTPGFVTMYMAKEAIQQIVIQKFNQQKGWMCNSIEALYNRINDKQEANAIVNSITICDPAVGSGHFLVSALNELIAIKSELKILIDRSGKTLRDYEVEVINDELIVSDEEGHIFEYNPKNKESQRVQEALFHEKEILIENCLFGVDINPNSVKICRLRLWIELLKNSYYTERSNFRELETLPNIDINIKCGNSIVSRFSIQANIGKAPKSLKENIETYKTLVRKYKVSKVKEEKKEIENLIDEIKKDFRSEISKNDPLFRKLNKSTTELYSKYTSVQLFESNLTNDQKKDKKSLETDISKLSTEIDAIKSNKIYENAFEWRFEFPEVLDEDGNYQGFDIIIGNPPYIPLESFSNAVRDYFKKKFTRFERKFESSVLFIDESYRVLKPSGLLAFIAPVTWQTGENYAKFRKFAINDLGIKQIINLPFNVFEDAYVDTGIYTFKKEATSGYEIYNYDKKARIKSLENIAFTEIDTHLILEPKYKIILNPFVNSLLINNAKRRFSQLGELTISTQGLSGSNFLPVTEVNKEKDFPYLNKGNVYNYHLDIQETFFTSLEDKPSLKPFYEARPKLLIRRIINRQDRLSVAFTKEKMVFKKDINPFIPIDPNFLPQYLLAVMASKLISYIYLSLSSIASKDDFRQTTLAELREVPIPAIAINEQTPFANLAGYILHINTITDRKINEYVPNEHLILQFEEIIDAMVYELFFEEEFHKEGVEFIKFAATVFPAIESCKDDSDREQIIHQAYQDLRQKDNAIRNNLKLMDIRLNHLLSPFQNSLNAAHQQNYH